MPQIAPGKMRSGSGLGLPRRSLVVVLTLAAAILMAVISFHACNRFGCQLAEERQALNVVVAYGYADPKVIEWSVFNPHRFGCDENDHIGFLIEAADGVSGRDRVRIRLNVCCGDAIHGCRLIHPFGGQPKGF